MWRPKNSALIPQSFVLRLALGSLRFVLFSRSAAAKENSSNRLSNAGRNTSRDHPFRGNSNGFAQALAMSMDKNIIIEHRSAKGKPDRLPELAAELARLKVDLIVAGGGDPVVRAAKNATKTIPIVMTGAGIDPVVAGHVESLARPGGNVTGITNLTQRTRREAAGAAQRGGSQSCPRRRSLRSGYSVQCTRGERGSDCGACAEVDVFDLGRYELRTISKRYSPR